MKMFLQIPIGLGLLVLCSAIHAAPLPSVVPSEIDFGEHIVGTTSSEFVVTLNNLGDSEFHIDSLGANLPDFLVDHECATCAPPPFLGSLWSDSICKIKIRLIPTRAGQLEDTLTINGNIALPVTLRLKGSGTNGLSVYPTRLDFGAVPLNKSATLSVILENRTQQSATLRDVVTTLGDIVLVRNSCRNRISSMVPGIRCKITYRYRPTIDGTHTGTTTFSFGNEDFPTTTLALTGSVGAPPSPAVDGTFPLSPSVAGIGETVTLSGSGFTAQAGSVYVGAKRARLLSWTNRLASFRVPPVAAGQYVVSVVRRDRLSASTEKVPVNGHETAVPLSIRPPQIDRLDPASGTANDTVLIIGRYFGRALPKVNFVTGADWNRSHIPVGPTGFPGSDTITIKVPAGLSPGGYEIRLRNAAGEGKGKEFTVR